MKITATDFKARCLKLVDQVREHGEPLEITKRGRVVASVIPAGDLDEHPWLRVRGTARWTGDPLAPAIRISEIDALK